MLPCCARAVCFYCAGPSILILIQDAGTVLVRYGCAVLVQRAGTGLMQRDFAGGVRGAERQIPPAIKSRGKEGALLGRFFVCRSYTLRSRRTTIADP
eukprot:1365309-Rhodomonas_salina.2